MTRPAQRLGRYHLVRRLAAGGMGEVYLAEAEGAANFTKQVAIKRILPHLAEDEGFVRKFIDEAHLMVQLHHGNIVPVLELADDGGELYLVMEYLPGRDLKAVQRRLRADGRAMPIDLAVWLVTEVLAGLDYAHRKRGPDDEPLGVVHRDVSPSNICLGAGGEVKLVDFGIARARGGLHQSISGTLQGKFVYMSPEQADGQAVDARSDVFAAGLVLYELLTDRRPFEGDSETETLRRVRECNVEPPSIARPEVPPALDAIVMRALAADPDARYPTAGEMRRALTHHLAVSRSEADAGAFARFLADAFPEGVVPRRETSPRSFDDALLMQLEPTGSHSDSTRTRSAPVDRPPAARTPTGPEARTPTPFARTSPSRPGDDADLRADAALAFTEPRATEPTPARGLAENTAGTPARGLAALDRATPARGLDALPGAELTPAALDADPVNHGRRRTDRVTGRRRMLALGLALGLGIAAAAALWPRKASLQPTFAPPLADAWIEVDGARLADGATLVAGRTYRICAHAPGHAPDCRQITLAAGRNRPAFTLSPAPVLAPIIDPAGLEARLTLDGVEIRQPRFPLTAGQTYTVCAQAPGHADACERFAAAAGVNAPRLLLTPAPTPPPDAAPRRRPDAAPPTPRPTAPHPPPPRHPAPARYVTLDSYTTAEVWEGDRRLGTTPIEVRVEPRAVTYELRAKGYAPTPYRVDPEHAAGPVKIRLQAPARLTVRAHPPAAEILLDGVQVNAGLSSIMDYVTTPGPHTLTIRYRHPDTGRVYEVGPRRIVLEPGKTLNLGQIVVPHDDARPGEPP
ncbi:MAG: serine/threonine protein kinase [Myxococcales bacterium]|nr:serine/threonine protein kinase [Myxococcales bacterium]